MSVEFSQAKWYLVQVDIDNSKPAAMRDYGVYRCWCHIRQYEDCTNHPTIKIPFWMEIITKNQDGTLVKMLQVRPSKVNKFLQRTHTYLW